MAQKKLKEEEIKLIKKQIESREDSVTKKDATIQDAKIYKISKLWKRKPGPLGFEDTEAVVVTVKTNDGKKVRDTFYTCIKPDGTFDVKALSTGAKARRLRLANFLKYYKIADEIKGYKITEQIKGWEGKKVKVVSHKHGDSIFVP